MSRRDLKTKKAKVPRLYADENIPRQTVEYLRSKKIPVIHAVTDKNFSGRDDEFHFNYAVKNHYILLTLDIDFLNRYKFPLRKNFGVIVITIAPPVSSSKINEVLSKIIPIIKTHDPEFFQRKILKARIDRMTILEENTSGKVSSQVIDW
jgi:predicted nuclease of predicted toxin-antitoxin system